MIRDNMKLYKNFSSFSNNCNLCSKKPNHFYSTCPLLHYFPDKHFLISKLNYSKPQIRTEQKYKRSLKRTNVLKLLSIIQHKTFEYHKEKNEEDVGSEVFEQENQEGSVSSLEKIDDNELNTNEVQFSSEPQSFSDAVVIFIYFSC